ncbi:hypothetical protein AgCh_034000 [Apium graveolens]
MTCYRCNQKGHLANECKIPKSGVTCYKCGKTGHIARECKSTGPDKALMNVVSTSASMPAEVLALPPPSTATPQATTRTFDLKMKDVVQNSEVITGTLLMNNVEAKVLIDSGATRSFISETFVDKLKCDKMTLNEAKKFPRKGCESFLVYIVDSERESLGMEDLPVVSKFLDVFPDELPGLPPDRQIEFETNLDPGTEPVRRHYIEWHQQK